VWALGQMRAMANTGRMSRMFEFPIREIAFPPTTSIGLKGRHTFDIQSSA